MTSEEGVCITSFMKTLLFLSGTKFWLGTKFWSVFLVFLIPKHRLSEDTVACAFIHLVSCSRASRWFTAASSACTPGAGAPPSKPACSASAA